jgi:hypothetical protein
LPNFAKIRRDIARITVESILGKKSKVHELKEIETLEGLIEKIKILKVELK